MRDYLAMNRPSLKDAVQYGVLGMRWGRRRTDAQLANDTAKRALAGEKVTPTKKAESVLSGDTSAAAKYARMTSEAKGGGAKNWSSEDLKFFNSRTEALSKVNKMFQQNPSWLQSTSKKVLQQAAQNSMQSVADGVAKKYIVTPIVDTINSR